VLDSGARAATTTFVQRGIGDVLLSWENEAILAVEKLSPNQFDIVVPSLSILAEPPVALIDKVADAKGTTAIAKEYLNFLYTIEGQTIIAQNYYRPRNEDILSKFTSRFAKVETLTIDDFGGWKNAQKTHFDDGGIFDEIIRK
jgi:sulfate transport system substrate-binding protein